MLEKELRDASLDFIKEHPAYVGKVAFWTTRRMLDLAGMDWSIHTASTISAGRTAAITGVICFWVFAVLAVIGAFTQRARAAPLWFWAVPLLMYLSVVFLVVETPRYRTAIDPFIVLLAALALTRRVSGGGQADRCPIARRRAARRARPRRRRGRARSARGRTRARRTVAQQLAVERVRVGVDQPAEERELRRAVHVQEAA